jgi:hypothetical protein
MLRRMYLDDERLPKTLHDWIVVRSVAEARKLIRQNGMPDYISFDHDLGADCENGFDLAKWIVGMDLDGEIRLPAGFDYNIHSANPVGTANIRGLLDPYLRLRRLADNPG